MAAATSSDRGSLMEERLQALHEAMLRLLLMLNVHSHGLYSTVTTLHEGSEYCLTPTVARTRDSVKKEDISVMQWVSGTQNSADE